MPTFNIAALKGLKAIHLVMTLCAGLILALFLTYYMNHGSIHITPLESTLGRNYTHQPFDMIDATQTCMQQTQQQFGKTLTRNYVDEHSTRWDENAGVFKVFMTAHIGNMTDYNEMAIQCYVDPTEHTLTHYRTVDLKNSSLISKALKFFR